MKPCLAAPLGARTSPSAKVRSADENVPVSRIRLAAALALLLVPLAGTAAEGRRSRELAEPARAAPAPAPAPSAAAGAETVSPASGFDAFRIIAERNIFNPNRVGLTRAAPEAQPPRTDEIALVGTVEFGGQRVALFESAEAAFRKSVREGETIGDFTVAKVGAAGVELVREGRTLPLRVAEQLRRPEGGEWSVVAAPDAPRADARAEAAAPEIPADASEVLKRLMRQREKQLK